MHKISLVRQFHITLACALTCHKAQGLTLNSVVVHCANEFVAGLMYMYLPSSAAGCDQPVTYRCFTLNKAATGRNN